MPVTLEVYVERQCFVSRHTAALARGVEAEFPPVDVELIDVVGAECAHRDLARGRTRRREHDGAGVDENLRLLRAADLFEPIALSLGDFRDRGFIGLQRSHIEIIELDALRSLSGHSMDIAKPQQARRAGVERG